jgi:predicted SAM-dependent methyltransferase
MVRKLVRRFNRVLDYGYRIVSDSRVIPRQKLPQSLSIAAFEQGMLSIPRQIHRKFFIKSYRLNLETGNFVLNKGLDRLEEEKLLRIMAGIAHGRFEMDRGLVGPNDQPHELMERIHYGCGNNFFEGWLNVALKDYRRVQRIYSRAGHRVNYVQMNLTEKHCFPADFFGFGYCEDFIEHLTQADSIIFLAECLRTFRKGGVLRLSFPGLEGVLETHYRASGFLGAYKGKIEAFTAWGHLHFYSRDEISLVAKHLGFSNVKFVEYGKSEYPELCDRDTRDHQIGLNTYVELTK